MNDSIDIVAYLEKLLKQELLKQIRIEKLKRIEKLIIQKTKINL